MKQIIHIQPSDTIFEIVKRVFERCNREQCGLFVLICWSLWNKRNKWLWQWVNMSVFGTKASALNLLAAWKKAQAVETKANRGLQGRQQWEKPAEGWIKVNVDAALFEENGGTGVASVARDAAENFLKARSSWFEGLRVPREAEALGLKEALSWARESNFRRCIFETDSQVLAVACKGRCGRSYFDTQMLECIELFKHFD